MNEPIHRDMMPAGHERLLRAATYASVATAGVLILSKGMAWVETGSVSLLSSLLDSAVDLLASLVNLLAVHHALSPADREHRFGHGKAEPLAGLGQSLFIIGSAVFLLVEAGRRLAVPQPIAESTIGIVVMVFSIIATFTLVLFQRHVMKRVPSVAIGADHFHYLTDLMVNGAVILALVLADRFGLVLADPIFGAAIALFILYGAWSIARNSIDLLMDREFSADDRERIKSLALSHPAVRTIHDLRTRSSGRDAFIQFHLVMDPSLTLLEAHAISDEVEARIQGAFPWAEIMIHEDPDGIMESHRRFA